MGHQCSKKGRVDSAKVRSATKSFSGTRQMSPKSSTTILAGGKAHSEARQGIGLKVVEVGEENKASVNPFASIMLDCVTANARVSCNGVKGPSYSSARSFQLSTSTSSPRYL